MITANNVLNHVENVLMNVEELLVLQHKVKPYLFIQKNLSKIISQLD
jgi:hypothetical protein